MSNISDESKLIIASNLTIASMLRDLIVYQTNEKPIKETDRYIFDKFKALFDLLSREDQ
jgi:hypothetical protein